MRTWGTGSIAAALSALALGACGLGDQTEGGLRALVSALGFGQVRFERMTPEIEAVSLDAAQGTLAQGQSVSAATARVAKPERTPEGWKAEGIALREVALSPQDEPGHPRLVARDVAFALPRTFGPLSWSAAEASALALLDGDGGARLTAAALAATLDTVGSDGDILLSLSATGLEPRPSWMSGLGAPACLLGAVAGAGPLSLKGNVRYRPSDRSLRFEDVVVSGRTGSLTLSMGLSGVQPRLPTTAGVAAALSDWDDVPADLMLTGLTASLRDSGAVAACLASYPDLGPPGSPSAAEAVGALGFLADDAERARLGPEIVRFAASPSVLTVVVRPLEPLDLRAFPGVATSSARGRYLDISVSASPSAPLSAQAAPEARP